MNAGCIMEIYAVLRLSKVLFFFLQICKYYCNAGAIMCSLPLV